MKRFVLLLGLVLSLAACSTAPQSSYDRDMLHEEVKLAIKRFKQTDPVMSRWFENAKAYAVFPSVGKGAVGVGGAYGRGEFYEGGVMTGYCDLSQGSIGFQLGGQAYSEIIFFQSDYAIESFKSGSMEFAAQASAVAVTSGASADADYQGGVLVFTQAKGGLMYEASVGGQRFTYVPK